MPFETFDDLASYLREGIDPLAIRSEILPSPAASLRARVELLGAAARARNPALRAKIALWARRVRRENVDVTDETLARVADIAFE